MPVSLFTIDHTATHLSQAFGSATVEWSEELREHTLQTLYIGLTKGGVLDQTRDTCSESCRVAGVEHEPPFRPKVVKVQHPVRSDHNDGQAKCDRFKNCAGEGAY